MVQNSLVRYIREQIRAGYSADSIRKYLLNYGYPVTQINEAMQFAYPPTEVRHVLHLSKMTIAVIIAVVCSLALISSILFVSLRSDKVPSQLLDADVSILSDTVEYGGTLRFTIELINLGKSGRYDVTLRYEVYDLRDRFIRFEEETIAVETRASSSVDMPLGDTAPGSYYLKATAFYDDETARATASFKVVGEKQPGREEIEREIEEPEREEPERTEPAGEEPRKECPANCNDNNECTEDHCSSDTGYACRHDKIPMCCGNGICESGESYENCLKDCEVPKGKEEELFEGKPIWDKVDMIADIAKTDKKKAIGYCTEIEQPSFRYDCLSKAAVSSGDDNLCLDIEDQDYRDGCYEESAVMSGNSGICEKIIKETSRDSCYVEFVAIGDYTVCDKIFSKYMRQSCESLKKLEEMGV